MMTNEEFADIKERYRLLMADDLPKDVDETALVEAVTEHDLPALIQEVEALRIALAAEYAIWRAPRTAQGES